MMLMMMTMSSKSCFYVLLSLCTKLNKNYILSPVLGTSGQHDALYRRAGAGAVNEQRVVHISAVHRQRGCSVRDSADGHRHHLRGVPSQVARERTHCPPNADADGCAGGSRRQRVQRRLRLADDFFPLNVAMHTTQMINDAKESTILN